MAQLVAEEGNTETVVSTCADRSAKFVGDNINECLTCIPSSARLS